MYNKRVKIWASFKLLSAKIPAAKDITLFIMNGAKKIVPPIKSTNLGEGSQLFAITL
jgi:phosphatidylethanolamine-binding protein (PEBP) family uncharacterized protein